MLRIFDCFIIVYNYMTLEHIKEQLSNRFIGILATNKGFVIDKPELDLGVDYTLKKPYTYINPQGETRYNYDGRYIDIQLKATTENSVVELGDSIKYDLESKSFNDLVERRNNGFMPLILILFVLPANRHEWVDISEDEIKLRRRAYWYIPPIGEEQTTNTQRIRVEIPKVNCLGIDCFNEIHQQFYTIPSI